eukprot:1848333-Pyramimonas_sp.AAC.1
MVSTAAPDDAATSLHMHLRYSDCSRLGSAADTAAADTYIERPLRNTSSGNAAAPTIDATNV